MSNPEVDSIPAGEPIHGMPRMEIGYKPISWFKEWGFGRYKFRHEPIFYAHVAGQSDAWYGDRSQSTLWEENKRRLTACIPP
jgi:hypothetical protein